MATLLALVCSARGVLENVVEVGSFMDNPLMTSTHAKPTNFLIILADGVFNGAPPCHTTSPYR